MFYGMIFDKGLTYDPAISDYLQYSGVASVSSNGYSSFLHGSVVDMLYFPIFKVGNFEFFSAIFNIADASISVGVITLLIFQKRFFRKAVPDQPAASIETNTEVSDKVQVS
jgi:signal peptidase II